MGTAIIRFSKGVVGNEIIKLHQAILKQSANGTADTLGSLKESLSNIAQNARVTQWLAQEEWMPGDDGDGTGTADGNGIADGAGIADGVGTANGIGEAVGSGTLDGLGTAPEKEKRWEADAGRTRIPVIPWTGMWMGLCRMRYTRIINGEIFSGFTFTICRGCATAATGR